MKKMPVLALCMNFGLIGCMAAQQSSLQAQAPRDDAQCQTMGYKQGTQTYLQCRQMLMNQHTADNQAQQAAIADTGARLRAAGAALQASSPPPPTTTTCHALGGGTVSCSSF
jgi:hypothetical protein